MKFRTVDNSFSKWADSKLEDEGSFSVRTLKVLAESFVDSTSGHVPSLSGDLLRSAEDPSLWRIVRGLEANGIYIEWTGRYNDDTKEFESFSNPEKDDYALSNYLGHRYKIGGNQPDSHWVDWGIADFSEYFEDDVGELFINWLRFM